MTGMCIVCYCDLTRCWPPAAKHHLIRRSRRRSDESWATADLCGGCHEDFHGMKRPGFPGLTLPQLLWSKRETMEWEPHRLEELYCRTLPRLEPLPERYLTERSKYDPHYRPMKPTHSPAAEEAMRDPFFMPGWTLTKVIDEQNRVEWQVIDGPRMQAGVNVLSRGDTDVAAIVAAVEENRRKRA